MLKFKQGDKIVCIDNQRLYVGAKITVNKVYIVLKYEIKTVYILDDFGEEYGFFDNRFILLKEYRKQKINKICLESMIE